MLEVAEQVLVGENQDHIVVDLNNRDVVTTGPSAHSTASVSSNNASARAVKEA